jgi:hypothetical protein
MANLPDAWVEDARNLDNAEQLLHSAHGILLETPAIGDFLRNETNKRIVVAPNRLRKNAVPETHFGEFLYRTHAPVAGNSDANRLLQ